MKNPLALALLSLLLFVPGCASGPREFVKRTDRVEKITLRTRGEPGQHFNLKLNLDGQERELSGVSPAEFKLDVCVLTGTVKKTDGPGTLSFQILPESGGGSVSFCTLTEPNASNRFRYHDHGIEVWF